MLLPAGRSVVWAFSGLLVAVLVVLVFSSENTAPIQDASAGAARADHTPSNASPAEETTVQFLGVVLPSEAVDVTATLDGHIGEIRVRMGDRVSRSAVLAVLDTAALVRADLLMAQAELKSAESEASRLSIELAQARSRLGRIASLSKQQLVPAEQLADAEFQEQLATARATSADSVVAQTRALVEQRSIVFANVDVRAPFEGTVSARYVDRGSPVGRGTPIVRLVRTTALKVRFAVPSSKSGLLRTGASIAAHIEDVGVTLPGVIEAVAPEIDSASQMLVAEAVFSGEDMHAGPVLAGRTARVTLGTRVETVRSEIKGSRE